MVSKLEDVSTSKATSVKSWFVRSLTLANFSTNMMDFLVSLFLIDIALTFFGSTEPVNVAYTSQLITISNLVSVAVGLLLSGLCLKFRYKTLLMFGILCISIGSIGIFLAPNFILLQIFYPFDGIGTILVGAMAYTLAGEYLPIERRTKAIGWIIAGSSLSGLIGSIVINQFFGYTLGWKNFMIIYVLPISLIALVLVYFNVPSQQKIKLALSKKELGKSFKQVFWRRSSGSCLIGNLIRYTGAIWQIYAVAFIRTKFDLPVSIGAIIVLAGMIGLVGGMIAGGHIVNRVGRQRLLVISTLSVCAVVLPITFVPEAWIAILLYMLGGIVGGLSFSTNINFTLEQTPEARGTMMSINSSFIYLGTAIGAAAGGFVLALFGYQILTFFLVGLDFIAALIFAFVSKEPCKLLLP